jgi:hypothetical protein
MPKKGYVKTKEHCEKLRQTQIGIPKSELAKQHMRTAARNRTKEVSQEARRKMSIAKKGTKYTESHKLAIKNGLLKHIKDKGHWNTSQQSPTQEQIYNQRIIGIERVRGIWYGSVTYPEPDKYCNKFNKEFKHRVRAYFDYRCANCGTPENGTDTSILHIHHVTSNKKVCCDDTPKLFVPLCNKCHGDVQKDKQWHEQYYTDMIDNYYVGKCYFTREEMVIYLKGK